jgi:hypothetical protein
MIAGADHSDGPVCGPGRGDQSGQDNSLRFSPNTRTVSRGACHEPKPI